MGSLSVPAAHLVGSFLGMSAFGLYTCLFIQTLYRLKRAPSGSTLVFVKLTILWILASLVLIFQLSSLYAALVTLNGRISATQYYIQYYLQWQWVGSTVASQTACIIADIFLCWRLYVIWGRGFGVLIAPIVLLLGFAGCCVMSVIESQKSKRYASSRNAWQLSALFMRMAVNALLMSLITWKIWRVSKSVSTLTPFSSNFYHHILRLFIESGALYAIVVLIAAIVRATEQNSFYIIITFLIPHVTGLVPTLIVLRLLSTQVSEGATGHDTRPSTSQQLSISRPQFARTSADITTTQISEMARFEPVLTLEHKTPSWDDAEQSDISFKECHSNVDLNDARMSRHTSYTAIGRDFTMRSLITMHRSVLLDI